MNKTQVYDEIYERIRASSSDERYMLALRNRLDKSIDAAFRDCKFYKGLKHVGSMETGHMLKWERDMDILVAMQPFEKAFFRDGVKRINGLTELVFSETVTVFSDLAAATYCGEHVGLMGVKANADRYTSTEGDTMCHPEFSRSNLLKSQHRDVVLAKTLFRTAGIRSSSLGGGFVAEQLISYFGSFENMLIAFSSGHPIFIDYSGKYRGNKSSLVVSYPYCGLKNMSYKLDEGQYRHIVNYVRAILANPQKFLDDANERFNRFQSTKKQPSAFKQFMIAFWG